jgi:peroxiredoxin
MTINPRAQAPALKIDTLDGGQFDIAAMKPKTFTMIVFYRGVHCGFCRRYLQELDTLVDDFRDIGVEVVAVSCDDKDRAEKSRKEWDINNFPIGYGMSLEKAAEWGLFISTGIVDDQPDYFSESGLVLVEPDGALHCSYVQSWPFARPRLADIRDAIVFATDRKKPARGEITTMSQEILSGPAAAKRQSAAE